MQATARGAKVGNMLPVLGMTVTFGNLIIRLCLTVQLLLL